MIKQTDIEAIVNYDSEFDVNFAVKVLNKAQEKANSCGENVYLCGDIGCVYYTKHSMLTMADNIITFVEPQV